MENKQQIIKKEKIERLKQKAAQKFSFVYSICHHKRKIIKLEKVVEIVSGTSLRLHCNSIEFRRFLK